MALTLKPGRYKVAVRDDNGSEVAETNLFVGDAPPQMPAELTEIDLPDVDRKILYADWLASVEGGRWHFEALQLVASLDCNQPAVRDWLGRWGEVDHCGE